MVLTPDTFVKTDFGFGVGVLFVTLAVFSLLRGNANAKRSPTGTVLALGALLLGGYIVGKYLGYDL